MIEISSKWLISSHAFRSDSTYSSLSIDFNFDLCLCLSLRSVQSPLSLSMPKKKRIPITLVKSKYNKDAIHSFHHLSRQLCFTKDVKEQEQISQKIQEQGGLHAYQQASIRGGSYGKGATGKWLVSEILSNHTPKTLLDVGALDGMTYHKHHSWLSVTSIDLNPQSHRVRKCDFFEMSPPTTDTKFDILCLSLVINFVGLTKDRGRMIAKTRSFLKPRGILYIVLPLSCVLSNHSLK